MSSRPSQKDGIEMPISTTKVMIRSVQPNWRTAETMPASRPTIEQRTSDVPARMSVAEKRSQHLVEDRPVQGVGAAEIAVEQVAEPDEVLLQERLVEAEVAVERATFSGVA